MNLLYPKFDPEKHSLYLPREINLIHPLSDSDNFSFGKKNRLLTAIFILTFTFSMTISSLGVSAHHDDDIHTPTPTPCPEHSLTVAQYHYIVNNVSYNQLAGHVNAGDQVTVDFILAGCGLKTLSFVSYNAPANFSLPTQTLFISDTQTYEAGENTLNITIPPCYYQVDFVYGTVISNFNPPQVTYGAQNRYIDGISGGNACVATPSPTPSDTPTPTPTDTSTPTPTPSNTSTPTPSPSDTATPTPSPTPTPDGGGGGGSDTTPTPTPSDTPTPAPTATPSSGGGGGSSFFFPTPTPTIAGPSTQATTTPPPQVLGVSKVLPNTGMSALDKMLFSLFSAFLLTGLVTLSIGYEILPKKILEKLE